MSKTQMLAHKSEMLVTNPFQVRRGQDEPCTWLRRGYSSKYVILHFTVYV